MVNTVADMLCIVCAILGFMAGMMVGENRKRVTRMYFGMDADELFTPEERQEVIDADNAVEENEQLMTLAEEYGIVGDCEICKNTTMCYENGSSTVCGDYDYCESCKCRGALTQRNNGNYLYQCENFKIGDFKGDIEYPENSFKQGTIQHENFELKKALWHRGCLPVDMQESWMKGGAENADNER